MVWPVLANHCSSAKSVAMLNDLILTLSCRDRPGITARVTGVLFELGGNILEAQQFNEIEDGEFFMRVAFAPGASDIAPTARRWPAWRQNWTCAGRSGPQAICAGY